MHPKEHSYGGGIMFGKILLSVNIINILFASEKFIVSLDLLSEQLEREFSSFNSKTLILTSNNKSLLVHNISFSDAFYNGKDQIILAHIDAVCILTDEMREKKGYPRTLSYEIINPVITTEQISGTDLNTGFNILIAITTNDFNLQAANSFKNYLYDLKTGPPMNFNPYLTNRMHYIGDDLQEFRYKHYQYIKNTQ